MSKLKDLTGQQFGHLTVIRRVENRPNDAHACWLCICDCGKEKIVRSTDLIGGRVKSCGCIKNKDLTGLTFNKLKVINFAYSKNGLRYWNCECECGNKTVVSTKSLISGNTKSCGCIHRETLRKMNIESKSKIDQKTIIGKLFGFLEVIDVAPSKNGLSYYLCKCHKCGNTKEISYRNLASNKVHSCGCLQSYGEQQLKTYLNNFNIIFKTQFTFSDLLSDSNYPLRFDFAIFNSENKMICLIEYQGPQHYDKNNPWYSSTLIKHDNMKKQYCKEHNILLYYCDKNTNIENFVKEVVLPMATIGV